jgi:acetyl esterase/lipase
METTRDVPYGSGSGRDLLLDIYRPDAGASQRTAVLQFHGGGWRRGSRQSLAPHAELLRADGFTAISVEYRLVPEAAWPAQVHDVKAAVRWVRAHAVELGIDPGKIVLEGFSAGAHISLVAAGTPGNPEFDGDGGNAGVDSSVAAVAAFYPPTGFHLGDERGRGTTPATQLLGDSADGETARLASPITHITPAFPPTFLLHGGADRVVPTSSSVLMHDALRSAGVATDLHVFAGMNHAFDHVTPFRELVSREVSLFFRRMVSDKDRIAQQVDNESPFARRQAEAAAATLGGTQ